MAKNRTSNGKIRTMRQQIAQPGGQARMRRELANQRRAFGAAGVNRAMRNWGIRAGNGNGARGGARGGRGYSGARNG